uniref:FtsX-like permease family protein n=1 Tax=Acetatifactor sp. TaxID=1872090 RepID=UPI004055A055
MKRTIWKSTFREMKQSFGRFFAILAIVALGVAFYAGLTVTKSAMVQTTQKYLDEQNFYDYRLLSTMGFRQEEADSLQEKEGVESVEGAISFDIICQGESGNDMVLKAHSITEQVNRLKLLYGRMPESADECVVDADLYSKDAIGRTIKISENNEEGDFENFEYKEYTIVGIAQSPLYIQFERGNTSLGAGKLSGFFYIPKDGFTLDFFTELYVKFTDDFALYSEEYDKFLAEKELLWEDYVAEAANLSFHGIKADAEEKLAEAKEEFATERADAEAELLDAEEQLADARVQLEDGEKQLLDAKEELEEAKDTIAENEKELAEAEAEIADKEKELVDGEKELEQGIAEWNLNQDILEASKLEIMIAQAQLAQQKATLQTAESEVLSAETALTTAERAISIMKQIYGEDSTEVAEKEKELAAARAELETGKKALADGKATIAAYEKQLSDGLEQISTGQKELDSAWDEIEASEKQIEDGKLALADAKQQIEDGQEQLEDGKKELEEGEQTLLEKEQEFADAKAEYEDGVKEYEDGLAEFNEEIANAEEEIADAETFIADMEEPDSYLLGRETNVGYVCFENDSSIIEGIAKIFPVFFFLVAALVCITTMNRMVEEQRTQIGVLKALGYSELMIMTKYMFYAGSAAIAGCIIGYFGGTWLFPNVIWYAYGIMYSVSPLLYIFDWQLAVVSLLVSILCSMGATWMSCRVELNQVAAQLMRPKTPKAGKRVFLEYIPFVWKRLGFLKKVSIRNIFRYKKRLIMMVLGISGCTALLVTGYGVKDSIANVATKQFDEIHIYDISVIFSEEFNKEDARAIEEVAGVSEDAYVAVYETNYDLVTDESRKAVNLVVFDDETDMTPFINLHTEEKEQIAFPGDGEVVITDKMAESFGLEIGDIVALQNEDMQEITATISGIAQNFIYSYAYVNENTYKQQVGEEAEFQSVYVNLPENTDLHQVSASLMADENVITVSVNQDMKERLGSMLKSLDLIVVVIILCAGGLAFIVLYNLTNINITERIREIATIKVLGFTKQETASYVFRENVVLTGMGIVVGMILGHYLHLFVMNEVNIDMVAFDIHVRPISYLYSVLLTFAFAWIVNKVMGKKLERVSMTESLKSVD